MAEAKRLLPCPFCGGAMRIESNRDWHRLLGNHDDEICIWGHDDSAVMMVPATAAQHSAMVQAWNTRIPAVADRSSLLRVIECAEELNKRPRPMCRDCGDHDGKCPNGGGLDCDMAGLFIRARAAISRATPQRGIERTEEGES